MHSESTSCRARPTLLADAKAHAARIGADVDIQLGATHGGYTAVNVTGSYGDVKRFIAAFS